MKLDTTLYFITDSTCVPEENFLPVVEAACKGGATIIQLREKDKSTREYMELARATHEITTRYGIPLIIDDRVDVALAIGAEGVHVGQSDMPVRDARRLMGPERIVGATTKTVPQALEAFEQGADYLGCGAIYPTTTHVKTVITPVETLKDVVKAVPIPVNAIGGLNKDNIYVLKESGIAGICAVSAIMKSADPESATRDLKKAFLDLSTCCRGAFDRS
ncbi:thiamine phosphate synthase [uncultured Fibrobacter sp.]|uniref:thiamine phosphate synthase n=1 Tax=uncultured Fibrobacter sp. TaxID=261512 RepID=UPI002636BFCB|nr:thiamine phosphate synthase [uncultured Fibrobacter sp.]